MALFSVPGSEKCETRPDICTEEYNPVCATYPCYGDEYCTKTYSNGCFACGDKKVIAYRPGDCSSPGGPHQNNPGNKNDFVDEPICKFFLADDYGVRFETLENNAHVEHMPMYCYIPGKCKNKDDNVCTAADRKKSCSSKSEPVCAYNYFTNNGKKYPAEITSKTMKNSCLACKDTSIDFWVKGACDGASNPPSSGNKASKTNTTKRKSYSSKSKIIKSG